MTPSAAPLPPAATPMDLSALLRQADWLQGLARSLVRDGDEAEDVWQEAIDVARTKLAGGGEEAALAASKPWLAGVVRNIARSRKRRDQQRRARESGAARERLARDASHPSPLEDLELVERQRQVLEQIGTLPPAQRRVILARFYEGLAPREIAAQTGVPVSTVKSQIQRGLGALRHGLDGAHGDRRSWATLLLPIASPAAGLGGTAGAKATGFGVALSWAVWAIAAILVGGIFVAQRMGAKDSMNQVELAGLGDEPGLGAQESGRGGPPPSQGAQRAPATSPAPPTGAPSGLPQRTSLKPAKATPRKVVNARDLLPAPASGATGALTLRTLQQGTSLPAPHIHARLFPMESQSLLTETRAQHTGPDGLARWEDLHPGRYRLLEQIIEVRESGTTNISIEIPWGAAIHGVVLDMRGQPVPDARVGEQGGTFTLSDDQGRFAFRGGGTMSWVGATAEGYQRSTVDMIHRNEWASREVELRMARGGPSISGRVISHDGALVAGVTVRAKELSRHDAPGGLDYNLSGTRCVSDPIGHFELNGLLPVPHEISIEATGLGLYKATVQVAPEQQVILDIQLPRPGPAWASSWNRSPAAGKNKSSSPGRDPHLSVQFVDENGAPLEGWSVDAFSDEAHARLPFTNSEGRIRTKQSRPWMQHLSICPPGFIGRSVQTFRDVAQSASPLTLTVTGKTGTIRGQITDAEGALPRDADMHLARINGIYKTFQPAGPSGMFEWTGVPPGTYEVRFQATGRAPRAIPVDLSPGETLDLGELISSSGGFVELEFGGSWVEQPDGQPVPTFVMAGDGQGFAWTPLPVDPVTSLVGPLPEGDLHLTIIAPGCALTHAVVSVLTGQTTKASVSLEEGLAAQVHLTVAGRSPNSNGTPSFMISYGVQNLDTGAYVGSFGGAAESSAFELTPLAPGRYRIRAADTEGHEGETIILVPHGGVQNLKPPELRLEP